MIQAALTSFLYGKKMSGRRIDVRSPMEILDDSYAAFNLIEGLFWIILGLVAFGVSSRIPHELRRFAHVQAANLGVFGVSDIVEALAGSFFEPGMEWLFAWKAINVILLVAAIPWYLWIRFALRPILPPASEVHEREESGVGEEK